MSRDFNYHLKDRKDFWNVPCNPILGYRIDSPTRLSTIKVKENFFKK